MSVVLVLSDIELFVVQEGRFVAASCEELAYS